MSGLLLRELESDRPGQQGDNDRVDRHALFLGSASKLGVKVAGKTDQLFSALGHFAEYITRAILSHTNKRARGATNTQPSTQGSYAL